MGFSVVSWAESDDIGDSVGTIGSKAQDVMGFDVSVAVGHQKSLLAAIFATPFRSVNNVVSNHATAFIDKAMHAQQLWHKCALGNAIKVIDCRLRPNDDLLTRYLE